MRHAKKGDVTRYFTLLESCLWLMIRYAIASTLTWAEVYHQSERRTRAAYQDGPTKTTPPKSPTKAAHQDGPPRRHTKFFAKPLPSPTKAAYQSGTPKNLSLRRHIKTAHHQDGLPKRPHSDGLIKVTHQNGALSSHSETELRFVHSDIALNIKTLVYDMKLFASLTLLIQCDGNF